MSFFGGIVGFARGVANVFRRMSGPVLPPPRYVYLAGPILGCTFGEATDWRQGVADALKRHNIIGVSPLRCEPLHGETYTAEYPDPRFGTPRAIAAKNRFDVESCDITLALMPKPLPGRERSIGTIIECAWADRAGKKVILCTDDPFAAKHPVLDATVDWKFSAVGGGAEEFEFIEDCVEAAVETIIGVLGGYSGGKNV